MITDARLKAFCAELAALQERYGLILNIGWGDQETYLTWPHGDGHRHADIGDGFTPDCLRKAIGVDDPGLAPALSDTAPPCKDGEP